MSWEVRLKNHMDLEGTQSLEFISDQGRETGKAICQEGEGRRVTVTAGGSHKALSSSGQGSGLQAFADCVVVSTKPLCINRAFLLRCPSSQPLLAI